MYQESGEEVFREAAQPAYHVVERLGEAWRLVGPFIYVERLGEAWRPLGPFILLEKILEDKSC